MTGKAEVFSLVNIIASPAEVAEEIRISPQWKAPLISMVAISLIIGWFMVPANMEPMRKIFVSSFGDAAAEGAMKGVMKTMIFTELVVAPLVTVLRWATFAGILYCISLAFATARRRSYKELFSLVSYAEIIFLLSNLVTVLVIYIRGINSIEAIGDLVVIKGVDALVSGTSLNSLILSVLGKINPFSAWYSILITIGIKTFLEISKSKALFISVASWIILALATEIQSKASTFLMGLILGPN